MKDPTDSSVSSLPTATPAQPFERIFGYLLELFPLIVLVLIPIFGGLLTSAYILFRDAVFSGQSFGKMVLGTKVLMQSTGEPGGLRASAIRNFPLAINFFLPVIPVIGHIAGGITGTIIFFVETVALLSDKQHRRLGDRLAGTIVVSCVLR